jgi:uncharacterized protein
MSWKLILVLVVTLSAGSIAGQEREDSRPLVTVYGTADMRVVPDVVDVSIGVEIRGKELTPTIEQQTSRITDAIALIRKAGVDVKDIQTDFANITPVYSDSKNGRNLDYFIVRKGIAFTLKDTAKFDALLAALIQSGVNRVQNVRFRATEIRKYRDQAREMAVVAAREKAVALAAKLDQELGKAFSIDEDDSLSNSTPLIRLYPGAFSNTTTETGGGNESAEGSLMLGQISIQARVKSVLNFNEPWSIERILSMV